MEFRPCIDIHNGKVKQIVGGSLRDRGDRARENFVSARDAAYYAEIYRNAGIRGGHVILLNGRESSRYPDTKRQALGALAAYPGGLQVGGGIGEDNALEFLEAGASHVIVTSYVFHDGEVDYGRLRSLSRTVGRERLVLDVSCRRTEGEYRVVTDRWQRLTGERVCAELLDRLSEYCAEFLVHGVDVEGKNRGIEKPLARMLGEWGKIPVTYAGGVHSYEDIELLRRLGRDRVHVTVGSALDLFGGELSFEEIQRRVSAPL